MSWTYLLTAIVLDVVGTVLLKQSEGFSKFLSAFGSLLAFGLSLFALALAMRKLEFVPVYIVWVGLGTLLVSVAGVWFYQESLSGLKIISILLIVAGVVGLSVASRSAY